MFLLLRRRRRRRRGSGVGGGLGALGLPAAAADADVAQGATLGPVSATRLAKVTRLGEAVVVVVTELCVH